jgi:hypothetical protein
MPISLTMTLSRESERPGGSGDGEMPHVDPSNREPGDDPEGISSERLAQIIKRLETGFYDSPEVRDHIARKAIEDLEP